MEDNYLISIVGTQELDGETDTVEVMTTGNYITKNGSRYIKYTEYDNDNPEIHSNNVVKVESDNLVKIIRGGKAPSQLILEKGRRHQCHYNTIMGGLMIGVFTDTIQANLTDEGGDLWVRYSLDFNSDLASRNEFKINIKKKGV